MHNDWRANKPSINVNLQEFTFSIPQAFTECVILATNNLVYVQIFLLLTKRNDVF
jgi:hypothetical protein